MLRRIFKFHRYSQPAAGYTGYITCLGKPVVWIDRAGTATFNWQLG